MPPRRNILSVFVFIIYVLVALLPSTGSAGKVKAVGRENTPKTNEIKRREAQISGIKPETEFQNKLRKAREAVEPHPIPPSVFDDMWHPQPRPTLNLPPTPPKSAADEKAEFHFNLIPQPKKPGESRQQRLAGYLKAFPNAKEDIGKMAEYIADLPGDKTDQYLMEAGFNAANITGWRHFTPYAKVETAILAAAAAGTKNAEWSMAVMSRKLADEYPSSKEDPVIKKYMEMKKEGPIQYRSLIEENPEARKILKRYKKEIRTIAQYISLATDYVSLLVECVGLTKEGVFRVMRKNRTNEGVIADALSRMRNEEDVRKALDNMELKIKNHYGKVDFTKVDSESTSEAGMTGTVPSIPGSQDHRTKSPEVSAPP